MSLCSIVCCCTLQDLLPSGAVKSDTVLYLVNSIYFGASWDKEFDEGQTKENEDFHVSNSKTEKVKAQQYDGTSVTFLYI